MNHGESPAGGGQMRVGLHALGIGAGARPEVIRAVAVAAEATGFATLWAGEHVVLVDRPTSAYPYSADGRIAVARRRGLAGPAARPELRRRRDQRHRTGDRHPAAPRAQPGGGGQQAATLDVLSAGRLTLGLGIGWSAEEFAALGVPFARRAQRTCEYVAAMRTLWADDPASFSGEFTRFNAVRVNPKPVRGGRIPIVLGGNSDASLARVATFADGWYGFDLPVSAIPERLAVLAEQCQLRHRDIRDLTVAVALSDGTPADLPDLARLGVTELVVVAAPPPDPAAATTWVQGLAAQWAVTPGQAG